MKIRKLVERGEPRPEGNGDDGDLEERLNQALKKLGPQDRLWADVDEQSMAVEVYILIDGVIGVDLIETITKIIGSVVPSYFMGVSGGSQHAVYLHYKMEKFG